MMSEWKQIDPEDDSTWPQHKRCVWLKYRNRGGEVYYDICDLFCIQEGLFAFKISTLGKAPTIFLNPKESLVAIKWHPIHKPHDPEESYE